MKLALALLLLVGTFHARASAITRFGDAPQEALSPKSISILVWNIHKGSAPQFAADYQRLSDEKHLVLLQEANLTEELRETLLGQQLFYTHGKSFTSPIRNVRMGVASGSRALPESSLAQVSSVREVRSATPKVVLFQTYRLKGRRQQLLVANVHAINFVPNPDFVKHILQISRQLSSHTGPMIVGGDFNTWNLQRLEFLDQLLGRVGLRRVQFPKGRTRFPSLGTIFGMQTGGELDQVYVRGARVVSTKVHAQITSSDHKPLELVLAID